MIILIVEDNLNLATFTSRNIMKEKPSWKVLVTGSCFEARNVTDHITPDIALIDLSLPDGNGLDLLFELRIKCQNMPAILTSASVSKKLTDEVNSLGGYMVLEKPFDFRDLVAVLEDAGGRTGQRSVDAEDLESRRREEKADGDLSPYSPWTYSPKSGLNYHQMLNRLSGLLAGIRAFEAEVCAAAGDERAVREAAGEYVDRLCRIVGDMTRMVNSARAAEPGKGRQ